MSSFWVSISRRLISFSVLTDYGNKVKKLDKDLLEEKDDQHKRLEERLKDRKNQRLREIEEKRKKQEQELNTNTVQSNSKITTEIKQIESLLDPIKDEEERMRVILGQQQQDNALKTARDGPQKDEKIVLSNDA